MREFKVIGHRGARTHEPQNTLCSLRRAIKDKADMVEVDLRWADGELVTLHDSTLERTTNGRGSVYEMPHHELRLLDAGRGERIPTAAEVLALVAGRIPINLELKDHGSVGPVCELVARAIRRGELSHDEVLVSSFIPAVVEEVRSLDTRIPIAMPVEDGFSQAIRESLRLGATSIHPAIGILDRAAVTEVHDQELLVYPFTVRDERDFELAWEAGADGCFADDPAAVRNWLERATK